MSAPVTPSQTIGPFFHEGLDWAVARRAAHKNDEWRVGGMVADANGDGVPDAMLEVWQPAGVFQRVYTDRAGRFAFRVRRETNDPAIAHVTVFARGLLHELRTRVYVGATLDELATRAELKQVPRDRLVTLMPSGADNGQRSLEWSIRLQGDQETVFFHLVWHEPSGSSERP